MEDVTALEDRVAAAFVETDGAVGVADMVRRRVLVEINLGVDEGDGLATLAGWGVILEDGS